MFSEGHNEKLIGIPELRATYSAYRDLIESNACFNPESAPIPGHLTVICPVYDAADVLPLTVRSLQDQLIDSGLDSSDILVVLNSGGGNTISCLDALHEEVPFNVWKPEVKMNDTNSSMHRGHNVWIIEQDGFRGKSYALEYVTKLLLDYKLPLPEWLMLIDAETRLLGYGDVSPINQLLCMAARINGLVSGNHFPCMYDGSEPMRSVPIESPGINYMTHVQTKLNVDSLIGGCIVGTSEQLLPLLATVTELFPGYTSEDSIMEVLAKLFGIPISTVRDVQFTNRVPQDRADQQAQLLRWVIAPTSFKRRLDPVIGRMVEKTRKQKLRLLLSAGIVPSIRTLLLRQNSARELRQLLGEYPDINWGPAWSNTINDLTPSKQ